MFVNSIFFRGGYYFDAGSLLLPALVGAVIGGGIGYVVGQQRAFWFRLQAQLALCQAQIEENTRLKVR